MHSKVITINRKNTFPYMQYFAVLFLALFALTSVNAASSNDKNYLRLSTSKTSDTSDLKITTIGGLMLQDSSMGFLELDYIESATNGETLSLDFGAGYAFNWHVSLYLALGLSVGYNLDNEDLNLAYYPEAGVIIDITDTFGLSVSAKRYHSFYNENDPFVMMSLVFRN